jgi:hypothetical protein
MLGPSQAETPEVTILAKKALMVTALAGVVAGASVATILVRWAIVDQHILPMVEERQLHTNKVR